MSHVTFSKKKKKKVILEPIIWYWVLYKEFCRGRVQLSSNLAVHRKRQIRHTITQMIMALEEYLRTLSSRFNTCIIKALKSLTRMHPKKKKVWLGYNSFFLSLVYRLSIHPHLILWGKFSLNSFFHYILTIQVLDFRVLDEIFPPLCPAESVKRWC